MPNCLQITTILWNHNTRTNPRQLRDDIYRAVEQLWQHPVSNTSNTINNTINKNKKEAALSR